jgi:hypothetical protein
MGDISLTRIADLKALVEDLDRMVLAGDILPAVDRYFAEAVVTQEGNAAPVRGKAANRARIAAFMSSLRAFNGATLHSYGVGHDVTLSEYTFDLVAEDGKPLVWVEVIRRRWADGLVIDERYYTTGPWKE